jgi:hypothetical protein
MTNFEFLLGKSEYALFAQAAVEAEKVYYSSYAMCAMCCRFISLRTTSRLVKEIIRS